MVQLRRVLRGLDGSSLDTPCHGEHVALFHRLHCGFQVDFAWHSPDGGETWSRVRPSPYPENDVRALALHPRAPHIVYAGTDSGVYRSEDRGASWARLDAPMNTIQTWALALDPVEPDTLFAGTKSSAVFRSRDGGQQWEQLSMELADECPAVVIPRVTALAVDPEDHQTIWAGVEVDGVRRSLDGGDTWTRISSGVDDPDIHGMAISLADPQTVLVSTPREVFTSTDTGESWQSLAVGSKFSLKYCRDITVKQDDPNTMFVAAGDGAFGSTGNIQRSTDRGQTWEKISLPVEPNTPMWAFATNAADPDLILSCSHYGQLFASADGGDWWVKLRKEFTEIRGMAWTPN